MFCSNSHAENSWGHIEGHHHCSISACQAQVSSMRGPGSRCRKLVCINSPYVTGFYSASSQSQACIIEDTTKRAVSSTKEEYQHDLFHSNGRRGGILESIDTIQNPIPYESESIDRLQQCNPPQNLYGEPVHHSIC